MTTKTNEVTPAVAIENQVLRAKPPTPPNRQQTCDLRLFEAAWLLQLSENATRRLCEQGVIPAWRCIDHAGSSARMRWNIPPAALAPLLKSAQARRCLAQLMAGEIRVPRPARRSDPARPLWVPRSRVSSDGASVRSTNLRSDNVISHVWISSATMSSDTLSGGAR